MAEILEDYEFRKAGRRDSYPYEEWFDGQVWKLYQGVDFDCSVISMRVNLYNAAKRKGIKIRTSMRVDAVILQREREV
tara:strand:- start:288 stop:521 length:234 start_codon:yes stop_codon:yes gene_type:complete